MQCRAMHGAQPPPQTQWQQQGAEAAGARLLGCAALGSAGPARVPPVA